MKIELTERAISFLYRMFFQPSTLAQEKEGYRAKDNIGLEEVSKLAKWLRTKVIVTKVEAGGEAHSWVGGWKGGMKDNFVRRLRDMLKYHEQSGMMVQHCESYYEAVACLEGKVCSSVDGDGVEE